MELGKLFYRIALEGMGEFNDDVIESRNNTANSSNKMVEAFKKIGAAVVTYLSVSKIVDFGKSIVDAAATVNAEVSAFGQIMGDYSDTAQNKLGEIADATGVVDTRLTPYMTSMTAKFKGLGYGIDDATTLASDGLLLASDAAAFWDKSLDESMSHLNSFINGSYEGGEAIGLFANDTQMAQYAIRTGIIASTKEWANLDEATKQATRLEYAKLMYEQSGATGQAAKEADQYANVQANLTEKWRQFKAQIGEPVLQNIVLPAMQKLSEFVDKASDAFERLKPIASDIAEFWREVYAPALEAVWEALKGVWESVVGLFSPLTNLLPKVDENKTAMDRFREVSWAIEDALYKLADSVGFIANVIGGLIIVWGGFKAGMAIQTMIQGFQTAAVQVALFSRTANGAQIAQAALNGTLKLGETIVALFTDKVTLAQLAQAGMAKAQAALNAVMSANPIALVITAIAALVAIFIVLWNQSESFRNFWIGLWEGIKVAAGSAVEWLKGAFQSAAEFFKGLWEDITSFLSTAWETIKSIVQVGIMFLAELFTFAFELLTLPWQFIWQNFGDTLTAAWEQITTIVSEGFTFIWEIITTFMTTVSEFLTGVWESVYLFLTSIIETISTFISGKFEAIKTVINTTMNTAKTIITTIWNAIKTTITNIINNVKTTVTNVFESIRKSIDDKLNAAKTTVTTIFTNIYDSIKEKIENAAKIVKDTIERIKGFFKFEWSLPHLKLPHVWISGGFSLMPPSVPSFGVDWYAKGGIMTDPTVFGYNPKTGNLQVGGEAGDEAVAPIDVLLGYIRTAVGEQNAGLLEAIDRLIEMLAEYLPLLLGKDSQLVLDTGVLVGHTAHAMNEELGDIYDRNGRGG
jgi:hypothetical protein